ncbi:MAG: hypothetical protein Kow0096_22830 [Thiohalomonadaceae bacterium]
MSVYLRIRVLLPILLLFASTTLAAAGYPSVLAREVPLYPHAQLDSASEHARGASAVINTTSPVDHAVRYYRDQLAGKGWRQTAELTLGTARALEFSRDQSSLSISILPTSAGTTIAVSLNR